MGKFDLVKKGYSYLAKNNWISKGTKLNPKKLGYVCSDKTINFATSEIAQEYAKNRSIQALKGETPFERLLVVDKNRILDEIGGDKFSCNFDIFKYKEKGLSLVHGHPDTYSLGCTTPISVNDAQIILDNKNFNEILAYNSKGEFSKIENLQTEKSKTVPMYTDLLNSINMSEKYKKVVIPEDLTTKKEKAAESFKNCTYEDLEHLIEQQNKINEEITNYQKTEDCCKKIHDFWTKYATKFGLKYSTNYSNIQ